MGLPMARHLAQAGYPLKVYNRTTAKVAPAKAFGAGRIDNNRWVGLRLFTLNRFL